MSILNRIAKMNIAIIYHDADFDGKLSNEVCRYHLNRLHPNATIHSYGWDYGRPVPDDEARTHRITVEGGLANTTFQWSDYDAIYIVDLSVDELMARPELREKIVWIDHHKSAIKKWDNQAPRLGDVEPPVIFAGIRIDGVAACRLCWCWFTWPNPADPASDIAAKQDFIDRKVDEPTLIRLAGEYDVWDHRDPDGKALQFGLRALSDKDYRILVESQFSSADGAGYGSTPLVAAIANGYAIKFYVDKQADEYSAVYAQTIQWEGLTFCALNIGQRGNSDLLRGGIKPEHDACFAWRWTGTEVLVSLYHAPGREHHDLSKIAVKHGGGGHKGACGFRIGLNHLHHILTNELP